ncbi:MAG TPA: hypothetical protein VHE13_10555 [Opitutus sp.]|nr:hypothetical protein [Opitutus sp.]
MWATAVVLTAAGPLGASSHSIAPVPRNVLVVGMRGRSVCLENRSLATIVLGGIVGAGIENAVTGGTRLPLVEALAKTYPAFRPERVVAEAIAAELRERPEFREAEIAAWPESVEVPMKPELRRGEDAPFLPDWQHRAGWILVESRWLKAPGNFSYLRDDRRREGGLACVEFLFGKVVINHGTVVDLVASVRIVEPESGRVVGRKADVVEYGGKIADIRTQEGFSKFESEFRRVAAEYAKRLIRRALE